MIVVNPATRQFNIPGADLVFGVTADANSAIKHFQCPRYVGNNVDIASSFVRINYQNAHGDIDFYLVKDVTVDGENVKFSWELHPKVTMYRGNVSFVMCVTGPDAKVKWHTTLGRGQVLEGLEPDSTLVETDTKDGIAALIAMVEAQTVAVEKTGADQVAVVKAAAKTAQDGAVAEVEAKGKNVRESIPNDYTSLGNTVDGLVRGRAWAIVCEAEGSAITVKDASDMAIREMRIFGRSTQDGVPTPENPVEIVSVESPVVTVCGKNLIPPSTGTISAQGITSTPVDGGTVMLNGTATQEISRVVSQNFLLPAGRYTLSVTGINKIDGNKDRVYLNAADGSGTLVNYVMVDNPVTFDMESSMIVRSAIVFAPNSTYENQVAYIQLEAGDVATPYEPYKVTRTVETTQTLRGIPVTSGGNYTDSDGQQWICDEVDLERGVCVKRIGEIVFDGTQTYHINAYQQLQGFTVFGCSQFGASYSGAPVLCDKLTYKPWGYWNLASGTNFICYETSAFFMYLEDKSITTVEAFREYLVNNPITAKYILATPIETPLSATEIAAYRSLHSNKPNTTILNDSGAHMKVEYAADTKLYIDNKLAALVGNN